MLSERVSVQRTGRPTFRANHGRIRSSGYNPILAPKPPPTSGAMTRTWAGWRPYMPHERHPECAFERDILAVDAAGRQELWILAP
jgi:hypothetical protein